jgi:Na+-translocating ferredoxin:NAD+ oxidoreductase RnfD subunit
MNDAAATVRLGHRRYPIVLPNLRDARTHVAAVIISLQILGQTVLGFELSIAQILVSIGTCAILEIGITFWRQRVIAWPASALLTGNGVALILRVPGTRAGDWWDMRGAGIFAGVAAVSLLSKYALRVRGRHVFNPSNIGLVVAFLVLGASRAFPQDLWWGPMSWGLALTYAVIAVGGLSLALRLRMLGMALAFWTTFAACIGVVALSGHSMTARWHVGPVQGASFWWILVSSPEVLVFLFFMITDPRTTPAEPRARALFGASVGFMGALLIAPQHTEFSTKVALLGSLAVVCVLRTLLETVPALASWRIRPMVHGVGAVAIGVVLLLVAALPGRSSTTAGSTIAFSGTRRPSVALGPGDLPAVTIDPAVRGFDSSVTPAGARRVARDVVADLAIGAEALKRRNIRLAATAATGTWLEDVRRAVGAAHRGDTIVVPTYTFKHLTVMIVRGADWEPAQLGVSAVGILHRSVYDKSPAQRAVLRDRPYARTFMVSLNNDHYLITAEQASSTTRRR